MEECESLDSEMTELQSEASDAISQADDDEVEELQNSLREAVQDQSVKPKFQCLMVDPSFSMVTVQSEDSGIVWETASSRCSTPWASETSSISEACSMEGSGSAGKITIFFDEEKVVRRRTRSGRSSRLGDRLSRPGSSRSASALGVERPEMMEVSQPNVKQEKKEAEPDLEEIKNKDQQLFSLISEGYEILNIRVPSKLPTVDEEESTGLQDNLSYLDQTPKIKSRNHHNVTSQNHVQPEEMEILDHNEISKTDPVDADVSDLRQTPTPKDGTSDIDYFEKFTLLDEVVPGEQAPEVQEAAERPAAEPKPEAPAAKDTATDSPSASEDSFVFVTDVEIVGEHLDEVFYGEGDPAGAEQHRENDEGSRARRESQRSKESGSVLFGSEETVLTPIYISPGPPKIIDPILLEEPTAMSFMYSDLYEDAVGDRRKSDEDFSEAESVASEKSYKRCISDSEEADGYLEKFILKDETPTVDAPPEPEEDQKQGRMMWSQSKFEMTGCLRRAAPEEDEEASKKDGMKKTEASVPEMVDKSWVAKIEEKVENVTDGRNEIAAVRVEQMVQEEPKHQEREAQHQHEENALQEEKLLPKAQQKTEKKQKVQSHEEKQEDQAQKHPPKAQQMDVTKKTEKSQKVQSHEEKQEDQVQKHLPKAQQLDATKEMEMSQKVQSHEEKQENQVQKHLPEAQQLDVTKEIEKRQKADLTKKHSEPGPPCDGKVAEISAKVLVETKEKIPKAPAVIEVPQTTFKSDTAAEISSSEAAAKEKKPPAETSAEAKEPEPLCEEPKLETEVPEPAAPVEVITDRALAVHAVVKVTENVADENQTKVQIDLEEAESADAKAMSPDEEHKREVLPLQFVPEADQGSHIKELPRQDVTTELDRKDVLPRDERGHDALAVETDKTNQSTETKTSVEGISVQEDDGLILLVPKGQAIEMDIEISQSDIAAQKASGNEEICHLKASDDTDVCSLTPREEAALKAKPEKEPEVVRQRKAEPEPEPEFVPPREASPEPEPEVVPQREASPEPEPEVVPYLEALPEPEPEFAPHLEALPESKRKAEPEVVPLREASPEPEPEVVPHLEALPEPEPEFAPHLEALPESKPKAEPEVVPFREASPEPEPAVVPHWETSPEPVLEPRYLPIAPVEEAETEKPAKEVEDELVLSPLRSFAPLQDLSELHMQDVQEEAADVEQKGKEAPETHIMREAVTTEVSWTKADLVEAIIESPEVTVEEYEMISKLDAREITEEEKEPRDAETPRPQPEPQDEERVEVKPADTFEDEELIEDDYEIIDAEEENQARLAAELQGMDWFCVSCECLLTKEGRASADHRGHKVTAVDEAFEGIKERLSDWIAELQGRSENIEDLVSELELAYNSVEEQFAESEAAMQAQNEEMMALVMDQYNSMSVSMEEEKKTKLEQLYDQIVSFQESIDSAKTTLETTDREAETDARPPEDIHASLKAALESTMSLELGPKGLLVFEDYAKGNASSSQLAQRKGIPVPQKPTLQPQEQGSATSTNVIVYWNVNPGDIIDCFQVYCMEDPQGAVSEEYRVTVKESYCVLEELEPDKTYKVWVMAVNYTGCSLPSERLLFRTAPSVPVIDTERCTIMWDSAVLRWSPGKQATGQSYTLEYCRQYELEGEGLRSISGIEGCEHRVLLQPNENYLFYIKAVTESGASDQSEAALISTKGTRFHLLIASAHPALELSADQTTLHYSQDAHECRSAADKVCPSILGEPLPARGHYYWETVVSRCAAYRLGVTLSSADRKTSLGENVHSWCLQCIPTPSGCRYQLLHNDVQSSVIVMEWPERVGTLLDYQLGRLCFYNAQSGQLLGAFRQGFARPCHAALALETPGSLEVSMVLEAPDFTKDS